MPFQLVKHKGFDYISEENGSLFKFHTWNSSSKPRLLDSQKMRNRRVLMRKLEDFNPTLFTHLTAATGQ